MENFCPNCFRQDYHGGKCPQCGYTAISIEENSQVLPPGTILHKRYLLGRTLGAGGFGITYVAMDLETAQRCAVKEYFPVEFAARGTDGTVRVGGSGTDEAYEHGMKRFCDEAGVLSTFRGYASIVQVYHAFKENNTAYFSMEFLDGVTLKALMRSQPKGHLSVPVATEVFLRVAKTLQIVHAKGLLHRDVSPENIFLTKSGEIKLIDFGATRYYLGERSQSLSIILKPGFAPPEQYAKNGVQGPWTDIYALAATYYLILTGVPLPDAMARLSDNYLTPLNELFPEIPLRQSRAIQKALAVNYKDRIQSVPELLSAFEAPEPKKKTNLSRKKAPVRVQKTIPFVEVFVNGTQSGKWALPQGMEVILGSSPRRSNIVINCAGIGEAHCTLSYYAQKGCFYLRPVENHAVYHQEMRLKPGQVYPLMAKDGFYLVPKKCLVVVGVE